jgi:hypothetical protein
MLSRIYPERIAAANGIGCDLPMSFVKKLMAFPYRVIVISHSTQYLWTTFVWCHCEKYSEEKQEPSLPFQRLHPL